MDIVKLAIIFALIVIFLGLKRPMALVILGATILLGVLFHMPPLDFCQGYLQSLISRSTIELLLIIWFVMLLEGVLSQRNYLQRMLDAIDNLFHSRRVDIIAMPMIIGFLPSAGGALFSAPMVDNATADTGFSAETKTVLNVYYRHVMELFFPTYPALIITAEVSGVPLFSLTAVLFPMTVLVLLLGLFYLRGLPKEPQAEKQGDLGRRALAAVQSLWPFLLLLVLIMAVQMEVLYATGITLLAVIIVLRVPVKELPQLIKTASKWKILLMSAAVMVFKDMLMLSGAVDRLPEQIAVLPLPPVVLFSLMTMFISMIVGITYASTAIVMPLLMVSMPGLSVVTVAFMHISAYIGAQLTPTHLCVSITTEYFGANLQKVLLKSLPVYLVLYVIAMIFYGFLLA